jgi:hypothetical protein
MDFIEKLKKEWAVIKSAPISFVFVMLVGWGAIHWIYSVTIGTIKETRDSYKEELARLKQEKAVPVTPINKNRQNDSHSIGMKPSTQATFRDNNGAIAYGENAKAEYNNVVSKPFDPLSGQEKEWIVKIIESANGRPIILYHNKNTEDLRTVVKSFFEQNGANVQEPTESIGQMAYSSNQNARIVRMGGDKFEIFINRNRHEN